MQVICSDPGALHWIRPCLSSAPTPCHPSCLHPSSFLRLRIPWQISGCRGSRGSSTKHTQVAAKTEPRDDKSPSFDVLSSFASSGFLSRQGVWLQERPLAQWPRYQSTSVLPSSSQQLLLQMPRMLDSTEATRLRCPSQGPTKKMKPSSLEIASLYSTLRTTPRVRVQHRCLASAAFLLASCRFTTNTACSRKDRVKLSHEMMSTKVF